jgi:hypothetical protein
MDSSAQALADATKLNNDLFELVEKQRIQLNEKNKELQGNRQANEVNAYFLLVFCYYDFAALFQLEKAQAIEAATDNLNTELARAQQTIRTLQMTIW